MRCHLIENAGMSDEQLDRGSPWLTGSSAGRRKAGLGLGGPGSQAVWVVMRGEAVTFCPPDNPPMRV